jgi:hypothetical protein
VTALELIKELEKHNPNEVVFLVNIYTRTILTIKEVSTFLDAGLCIVGK